MQYLSFTFAYLVKLITMKKDDLIKAEMAKQTFADFLGQFGERDEVGALVLEILFEELYGAKNETVFVPTQKR